MRRLQFADRLHPLKTSLRWRYFFDDAPSEVITDVWIDTFAATNKSYVVQTATSVIQRCLLMTTDPGDLVLDPTCGSGTTAYVAEQWGQALDHHRHIEGCFCPCTSADYGCSLPLLLAL